MNQTSKEPRGKSLLDMSDAEVILAVRAGQLAAFEAIMRRYNQRLFRIARSIVKNHADAEDVVQEAYIKAYRKLDQLKTGDKFAPWVMRITVNEAISRYRQNAKHAAAHSATPIEETSDTFAAESETVMGLQPERLAASAAMRRFMEAAIDNLPSEFRSVFVLRTIEQLSISETADCLDLPENTVKSRLHRATKRLQTSLDDVYKDSLTDSFSFDGERCDRIVRSVLSQLSVRTAK